MKKTATNFIDYGNNSNENALALYDVCKALIYKFLFVKNAYASSRNFEKILLKENGCVTFCDLASTVYVCFQKYGKCIQVLELKTDKNKEADIEKTLEIINAKIDYYNTEIDVSYYASKPTKQLEKRLEQLQALKSDVFNLANCKKVKLFFDAVIMDEIKKAINHELNIVNKYITINGEKVALKSCDFPLDIEDITDFTAIEVDDISERFKGIDRQIFNYRYIDGLTVRQTAEKIGISKSLVSKKEKYIKIKLEQIFKN